jgi:hypothetical protein
MTSPYHNMTAITTAVPPKAFSMDRAEDDHVPASKFKEGVTDACQAHLQVAEFIDIRQTRRGFCQGTFRHCDITADVSYLTPSRLDRAECLGCEARSEFNYFNKDGTKIAHSLEESGCFCRVCCAYVAQMSSARLFSACFSHLLRRYPTQIDAPIHDACQ